MNERGYGSFKVLNLQMSVVMKIKFPRKRRVAKDS